MALRVTISRQFTLDVTINTQTVHIGSRAPETIVIPGRI